MAIGDGDSGCGIAGAVAIGDRDSRGAYSWDIAEGLGQQAKVLPGMALSEEDAAALRADLIRLQRDIGTAEAVNREYEVKLERLRKERSMGTSFDGQGGGGSADRWGTAATTMGSMWTRGVSVGSGLGQGLFYVPQGVVPKSSAECPPWVYITWE